MIVARLAGNSVLGWVKETKRRAALIKLKLILIWFDSNIFIVSLIVSKSDSDSMVIIF